MRRLLYLVAALAVAALVADVAAKQLAEARIEEGAESKSGAGSRAEASLGAFPFLPGALLSGRAGRLDLEVSDFRAGVVRISSLQVELGDVRIDEEELVQRRRVLVTRIRRATVAAELSAGDLAGATGLPLTIDGGRVAVEVAGRPVPVSPRIDASGSLRLGAVAVPAKVLRLEVAGLVGCTSTEVAVRDDRLRVSCTTPEIPPVVLQAAQDGQGWAPPAAPGGGMVVPGARNERWWSE